MAFCGKCGAEIADGAQFCPSCGAAAGASAPQGDFTSKVAGLNNTPDSTAAYDPADIRQNKAMAILAYIGLLFLIPLFAAKDSKFARFHTNQGIILAICAVAYGIVYSILSAILLAISFRLYFITVILYIPYFAYVALMVIGIINASKGLAKELPFIGKFRILK